MRFRARLSSWTKYKNGSLSLYLPPRSVAPVEANFQFTFCSNSPKPTWILPIQIKPIKAPLHHECANFCDEMITSWLLWHQSRVLGAAFIPSAKRNHELHVWMLFPQVREVFEAIICDVVLSGNGIESKLVAAAGKVHSPLGRLSEFPNSCHLRRWTNKLCAYTSRPVYLRSCSFPFLACRPPSCWSSKQFFPADLPKIFTMIDREAVGILKHLPSALITDAPHTTSRIALNSIRWRLPVWNNKTCNQLRSQLNN